MRYKPTPHDIITSVIGSLVSSLILWIIGGVISYGYQSSKNINLNISDIFCISMPLWVLLLILTFMTIVCFLYKLFRKRMPFLKEYEMTIGKFRRTWRWKYEPDSKQYIIYDLKTYCPQCNAVLTCEIYSKPAYQCINGHGFNYVVYQNVMDTIVDNIRNKYPEYRDFISCTSY